jgi:pimeloyl-ACP methyl ester carboxylesterase
LAGAHISSAGSPGVFSHTTFRDRAEVVAAFERIPGTPHLEVIPTCGHLLFLEQPDAFAAAVKTFLRTC